MSFKRHVWYYELGDCNLLRNKASEIDWDTLKNDDIDVYANNIQMLLSKLQANVYLTKK